MSRAAAARYGIPFAVFAAVLAGLVALTAGGDARPGGRRLEPVRIGFGAGAPAGAAAAGAGAGTAEDAPATTFPMHHGGRIVIPDELLEGQPTEGPVHDVSGTVGAERIATLARALGLTGPVESDADGWVVRDGSVALRVFRQPGVPWHYGPDKETAVARGTATAEPAAPDEKPVGGGTEPSAGGEDTPVSSEPCDGGCDSCAQGTCVAPEPATCQQPVDGTEPYCPEQERPGPPPPTDEEARAAAQRVFTAAGVTIADVTVEDGHPGKAVVAAPRVGGLPTNGFETRVSVPSAGVVAFAHGHLGTPTHKGDYPLLAPREAVERGASGAGHVMIAPAPCPPGEPCPTPRPREARTLRLGLTFLPAFDSRGGYLAPAWLMTFPGTPWVEQALALPDEYVEQPPRPSDAPAREGPPQEDPAAPDAPVSAP